MVEQKNLEGEIRNHVEELIASDPSLFIVEVSLKGNFGNQRLTIALDGDQGVSIETCVSISRQLSAFLEEKDMIEGKYHLEVTSAGVDHPLVSIRQYTKNVDRLLQVKKLTEEIIEGKLKKVDESEIILAVKEKKNVKLVTINFEEIESSKVLVSFK